MKKLVILFLFILTLPLFSHGAEYTVLSDRVIKIEARFDTGEYFENAEVLVYYPGESQSAYSLRTDEKGCFYLQPDREGTWILQVRGDEGHGLRINLPIDESMLAEGKTGNSLSIIQKLIMVISIGWGAMGTALYFKKRN